MKRAGNLWPDVVSWRNLLESALAAARGKRRRPDVAQFLLHLEPNVCALQRELEGGSYQPGGYRTFWIRDPKPRMISAASFRDRVVHHALTRVLEAVFEPRFTSRSFASRKGYGQHQALEMARRACGRHTYVLKCDVKKYFPSLDHGILMGLLGRAVKCPRTLALAARIVDASNPQEDAAAYFPEDTLFTPFERRRGLPIGNQTSQFFSNVYLNPLDHFVMRELQPPLYLRYVDDFVLFGNNKDDLGAMRNRIVEYLAGLRLRLHEGKSRVYRCEDGLRFLGWRLFPGRARLPRPHVVAVRRRLRAMEIGYQAGLLGFEDVRARVQAWIGHAAFGDTWRLRQALFHSFILMPADRGRRSARRLLEQQSTERARLEP
ncbi:MAG: reverse transcriptase/maturase family protein [Bryobacteraceae bacterium]